jgi:DNA-binding response OmpR family regulator
MPGMSGDDVLSELVEQGYYGRVVIVTAVGPGIDVLEMPFDDYLCKPVDCEDVRAVIDQQQRILAYETPPYET